MESRINHSKSGSCNASKTRFQVPLKVQLSNRFQTEFQFPNRSGKSRQGAVRAIQSTALTNSRFSIASQPGSPGRPARKFSIRPQSASEIAWRGSIDCLSWSKRKLTYTPTFQSLHGPAKLLIPERSKLTLPAKLPETVLPIWVEALLYNAALTLSLAEEPRS